MEHGTTSRGTHSIAPGLVLLKGLLDQTEQVTCLLTLTSKVYLAEYAMKLRDGFYSTFSGEKRANMTKERGRIYNSLESFPNSQYLLQMCNRIAQLSREKDENIPCMEPTHLLLLQYEGSRGIGWHSDTGESGGDGDHPIVSVSIGNSCEFGYRLEDVEHFVTLESGDVIVWGGPLRMLKHCVKVVNVGSCPEYLDVPNVRINYTFRQSHSVRGKEAQYANYYGEKNSGQ